MASGERHFPKARTEIPACDLLIDSGAFTFQTKGDMPLSDWIAMAHRVKPFGNEIIALDVIGDPRRPMRISRKSSKRYRTRYRHSMLDQICCTLKNIFNTQQIANRG
jgi:hypothetical protein